MRHASRRRHPLDALPDCNPGERYPVGLKSEERIYLTARFGEGIEVSAGGGAGGRSKGGFDLPPLRARCPW